MDLGWIVFEGSGSAGEHGLYIDQGGLLAVVVDEQGATFTNLHTTSLDFGWLAFIGEVAGSSGIYLYHAGQTDKVLAEGDPFEGASILTLTTTSRSVVLWSVVFRATLNNGDAGIWIAHPVAQVPTLQPPIPLVLVLLLVASAPIAMGLRRIRAR